MPSLDKKTTINLSLYGLAVLIPLILTVDSFVQNAQAKQSNSRSIDKSKIKIINHLGGYNVRIGQTKLEFAPEEGRILSALDYLDSTNQFNFNLSYEVKIDSISYYFRFGWCYFENEQTIFNDVNWLGEVPNETSSYSEARINSVHIAFKQVGSISLCTIGDSQTWWNNAQSSRKNLKAMNSNNYFKGSNMDIFGYRHEGEGGNSTKLLLKRAHKIPKSEFYTLLIGTNDWQEPIQSSLRNIKALVNIISNKAPNATILYLSPLPTTNKERNRANVELFKQIKIEFENHQQIVFVDTYKAFTSVSDWQTELLTSDGLHQSEEGVSLMAKEIM